jgi:hypothetical protein
MSQHICGNPSFDMFTCLACHPESAPKEPPARRDPFEEGVACATYSFEPNRDDNQPVVLSGIWVSLYLTEEEFEEFKAFAENRKAKTERA